VVKNMSKSKMMEFAEALKVMQDQRDKILTKIKADNFANSKKLRNFASENDEPTALAVDIGKPIPTLKGEAACRFLRMAKEAEEEVKKRRNTPLTIEQLEQQLSFEEFFLQDDLRAIKEREERIRNLKNKIKELKDKNGKAEEE
jgi:hypothetical protein